MSLFFVCTLPLPVFCRWQVSGHLQDLSLRKGETVATGSGVQLGVEWTIRAWMG